jgi:hypothetical protein
MAAQTCTWVVLTVPYQARRHPQREDDARDPLQHHEQREQPVGPLVDIVLRLCEQLVGAAGD